MKYKEFKEWCIDRASDGCWGSKEAILCIQIREIIDTKPFWERERIWRYFYEKSVVETIIKPIYNKMIEVGVLTDERQKTYQKFLR